MTQLSLADRLRRVIPAGASTYSKASDRYPANAPRAARNAEGPYVFDQDGHRFIDYTSALGAVILGHCEWEVEDAIHGQLRYGGISLSLPTELECELAERLVELIPCAEMIRFAKSGHEVTNGAIRIARAATGRDYVVMVRGGYHGMDDWSMGAPPKNGGILRRTKGCTLSFERSELGCLYAILRSKQVACVIIEPVSSSDPQIPPAGYFKRLREFCDQTGTLLIFDEMVTGWRSGIPGYPTDGVVPDLACYGKAIANGMPLSVLAGPRKLMQRIERDVFFSTTFGGECLSLAAAQATIDVLIRENVPSTLFDRGNVLQTEYAVLAYTHGLAGETELYGYPSRLMMRWHDPEKKRVFLESLIESGILTQGYFNLMLAHDDSVIEETVAAFDKAFAAVVEKASVAA